MKITIPANRKRFPGVFVVSFMLSMGLWIDFIKTETVGAVFNGVLNWILNGLLLALVLCYGIVSFAEIWPISFLSLFRSAFRWQPWGWRPTLLRVKMPLQSPGKSDDNPPFFGPFSLLWERCRAGGVLVTLCVMAWVFYVSKRVGESEKSDSKWHPTNKKAL